MPDGLAKYQIKAKNGGVYEVGAVDDAHAAELEKFINARIDAGDADLKDTSGAPTALAVNQAEAPQAPAPQPDTRPQSYSVGFGEGALDVINHGAQWLENIPGMEAVNQWGAANLGTAPSADAAEQYQNEIAKELPYQGSGLGKFAGTVATTLPLSRLPGGAFTQGAIGGGLLSDATDGLGVAKDIAVGGIGARVGQAALTGLARIAQPVVEPAVRRLLDAGVRLTGGQMASQSGVGGRLAKNAEDIFASVPFVGGGARAAQRTSVEDFNRAATNRALTPIGETLPANTAPGHDAVGYAADRLRQAYTDVLPRLNGTLDRTFETRVNAIRTGARLPPEYDGMLGQAQQELGNAFQRAGPNGAYSGRTLRDASERLEDLASGWRRSDDPYTRMVGDAAEQMRQQLHALARRQNPQHAARLRDIDRGYASLVRVERAALSSDDGVFSPAAYKQAVKMSDRSTRRRESARGRALDQDLARDASMILPNNAAQGGSKDVNSVAGLIAGGAAAATGNPYAIAGGAAAAGGSLLYTPAGQATVRSLFGRNTNVSPGVSQLLQLGARATPFVAAPAAASMEANRR